MSDFEYQARNPRICSACGSNRMPSISFLIQEEIEAEANCPECDANFKTSEEVELTVVLCKDCVREAHEEMFYR